jgi:hypothetical protein
MKWQVKIVGHAYGTEKLGIVEGDTFDEAWAKAEDKYNIHEGDYLHEDLAICPCPDEAQKIDFTT